MENSDTLNVNISDMQSQLIVINQYLLELYDQYPQFWKHHKASEGDTLYQEAWKGWVTQWENEQQGKKTFISGQTDKLRVTATSSLKPSDFRSFRDHKKAKKVSRRRFSAEYPRNEETDTRTFMLSSSNSDTTPDKVAARVSRKHSKGGGKTKWATLRRWGKRSVTNTPTNLNPKETLPAEGTKIKKSESFQSLQSIYKQGSASSEEETSDVIRLEVGKKQSDSKMSERVFRSKLSESNQGGRSLPLFIEFDDLIQLHIPNLIQGKHGLSSKITQHQTYWKSSYVKNFNFSKSFFFVYKC